MELNIVDLFGLISNEKKKGNPTNTSYDVAINKLKRGC